MDHVVCGRVFLDSLRVREGALWASDIYAGDVIRISIESAARGPHVLEDKVVRRPSGIGWLPDGTRLTVSMRDRCVLAVKAQGAEIYADVSAHTHRVPNELLVHSSGDVLVGTSPGQDEIVQGEYDCEMIRIRPTGEIDVVARGLAGPNGMVETADGAVLIAETMRGRVLQMRGTRGGWSTPTEWIALPMHGGRPATPDGMAFDPHRGLLAVADPASARVYLIRGDGQLRAREISGGRPFGCAFAEDGDSLYVSIAPDFDEARRLTHREAGIFCMPVGDHHKRSS